VTFLVAVCVAPLAGVTLTLIFSVALRMWRSLRLPAFVSFSVAFAVPAFRMVLRPEPTFLPFSESVPLTVHADAHGTLILRPLDDSARSLVFVTAIANAPLPPPPPPLPPLMTFSQLATVSAAST
jgi:hypothetical protein